MKDYSIIKVGNDYIVETGGERILKVGSRRRAARLVADASELLDCSEAPALAPDNVASSSSPELAIDEDSPQTP